ncbi:MAG: HD domain-containing protein [Ruminococcaceae bacterium]|nr:HD domain-containing protein [Oscillospiraceae bacterium]
MFMLPEEVNIAFDMLTNAGFEAYIVGGCVRDFLMGTDPDDFDITTSALPFEIKEVFKDFKVIETGLKHGTVTVVIKHFHLEITTFRTESSYSDNRHPDHVHFTRSLKEDLARRDFTVNAMAYNPVVGLVDIFGGRKDLENKIIRTVGEAKERFSEDALRILRALRFASKLGFDIEENTLQAARELKESLKNVAAERVYVEFTKLLCGKNTGSVLMSCPDILGVWVPEILPMVGFKQHNFHHIYDVWEHTVKVVENVPAVPHLRLAALMHDMGKPGTFSLDDKGVGHFYGHPKISTVLAGNVLNRLKVDNETRHKVVELVRHHDTPLQADSKAIKRKLNKLGEQLFFDLIDICRGDNMGQAPEYRSRQKHLDLVEETARSIINQEECFSLKTLAVNGSDLMAVGFKPGPELGEVLKFLLELVMDSKIENSKEDLLKVAVSYCQKP